MQKIPPVICLMGPTASGKTALAVELVQRFPMEIVSVDSALVYQGMDIGTAKPDAETLRLAPHRLIDIRDPADAYSAAEFAADARRAIADIRAAGRVPLLVGGTMLYYRALLDGLAEMPAADPQVRRRIEREAAETGWAVQHARLAGLDSAAAARIHPNDSQRIQRALEVYEITGLPLSEWWARARKEGAEFAYEKWVVSPEDRSVLHERIEQRFHAMVREGFVEEVAALRARGDLDLGLPSMKAVGYRQVWEHLDGAFGFDDMVRRGIAATRQFAKRQLTWLRGESEAIWFQGTPRQSLDEVLRRAGELME